jgi:hypothetical protein
MGKGLDFVGMIIIAMIIATPIVLLYKWMSQFF